MKELLETIVSELVENKDADEVDDDEPNAEGIVVNHHHVAKGIRGVLRAGASRLDQKIMVEID